MNAFHDMIITVGDGKQHINVRSDVVKQLGCLEKEFENIFQTISATIRGSKLLKIFFLSSS